MNNQSNARPVAIITGSAERIGKAISIALHNHGYDIVLHYFRTSAQPLAEQLNTLRHNSAVVIQADVNKPESAEVIRDKAVTSFGRIDTLINNASSFYPTPIGKTTTAHWHDLLGSNAMAPFFLSQACAPQLNINHGSIVNIADIYASAPKRHHTVYCMAKAANAMLTKSLAVELAPEIRVNGVAPGAALWPNNQPPSNEQEALKAVPLNCIGGAKAIVETVVFLVTAGQYITGQIICVDGGKSIAGIA